MLGLVITLLIIALIAAVLGHRGSRGGNREDRFLRGAGVVRHIVDCGRHARRLRPAFIVAFSKDWTASRQDRPVRIVIACYGRRCVSGLPFARCF